MYILYIHTYIVYTCICKYSIRLVVVISLKCSIGSAKYININTGWIKQQNHSSTLLWVSRIWQLSGVHILNVLSS